MSMELCGCTIDETGRTLLESKPKKKVSKLTLGITIDFLYISETHNRVMSFRKCVHCNREYEDVFNRRICSDKCSLEIS